MIKRFSFYLTERERERRGGTEVPDRSDSNVVLSRNPVMLFIPLSLIIKKKLIY